MKGIRVGIRTSTGTRALYWRSSTYKDIYFQAYCDICIKINCRNNISYTLHIHFYIKNYIFSYPSFKLGVNHSIFYESFTVFNPSMITVSTCVFVNLYYLCIDVS